ncbi:MAG TPA: hypothetical protein DDW90_08605 [Cyanobacteria bacterium UBA9971]|nr:hypothetical protein [Cyanobacteria bacterium UBA9971]
MKIFNNRAFKYIFAVMVMVFSLNSAGFAQVFSFEKNPNLRYATFPSGTLFKGALQNQLSSANSKMGDKVYLLIPSEVKIGENTCIPKKSILIGQVIQAQKAQPGKNGFVQIKFEAIKFPDGWGTQLSAHVWSDNGSGIIGGETTKMVSYKKVPHYMQDVGTVVQLVQSGQRAMGQEKFLPAGTEFVIVLDNDLEVKYIDMENL